MRAGSLRHKVRIETPTKVKGANATASTTWELFAEPMVSIEQLKAYDKAALAAVYPGADYTITLRFIAGLTANMRVVFGEQVFSILGQPNDVDHRHREIILTCESGVKPL